MMVLFGILKFFVSPLGRWIGIGLSVAVVLGGTYTKGRVDGRTAYKAKIERQIKDAVQKGNDARDNSLRELDAGRVPDDWFRD